jgi:hypothetical protein
VGLVEHYTRTYISCRPPSQLDLTAHPAVQYHCAMLIQNLLLSSCPRATLPIHKRLRHNDNPANLGPRPYLSSRQTLYLYPRPAAFAHPRRSPHSFHRYAGEELGQQFRVSCQRCWVRGRSNQKHRGKGREERVCRGRSVERAEDRGPRCLGCEGYLG